ncbi:SDR family NAD(P)-dependent oxidoreductase [Modestobacter sp. I12A-02628]|uniref:SDR family NAD(P)-dependent oxidoreductase n=1 Tax=Goekera deserti TaxID=2497753 RepID=A0A7K3WIR4_9ACTN|nr:SDR family NAD(P)-dependent oxidoreductase [Goekera deserti]MPQ97051.1 SDR family NAD(P)-dependent oxidoreductase [Goekera deserti]NDI46632.1 SDR family NAD(P)-dependent oxidoreductase [Goekera deserti]NEL56388.1 SDR family NAD(P)-dependent oxidoreductase [Goekera deserti]
MQPYVVAGGTAVVTGAAGGIGSALAHSLAARGSHLVLVDRDAERLELVAKTVRAAHPAVTLTTHVADLSDAEQTRRLGETLAAGHPETTLLVNNAGVALGGRFDQTTLEEFEWVITINFTAAVRLTHALLPVLKTHPGAHVVNVSSLFGLIAPAGQTAYSASKFAIRGFTEALRHELVDDGIGVTSVHPGGIRTGIAAAARVASGVPQAEAEAGKKQFEKLLTFPPEQAAELIVAAVEKRRPRLLIGMSAVVPDLLARVAPGSYGRLLAGLTTVTARLRKRR